MVAATVSGAVVTPDGRGVRNATVMMTDQLGITRSVITNSFGFYTIENVVNNQQYTMRVGSRRYRFTTQVVSINGNRTVDFTGLE